MASRHILTSQLAHMSKLGTGAVVLFLAMLFAQPAAAAPPGPDGNRGHLNRLLHSQALIEHLGFTDEQARSAQAISNEIVENHRAAFEKALKPETKAERVPLVKDVFISVNEDTFKRLESVISADQHRRLEQIEIQTFGIRALGRPAVIKYLELTPSQTDALDKVGDAMGARLSGIHKPSNLSASEKKEAAEEIRNSALSEARRHIGPEQWVKWELLVGAEFPR